MQIYKIGELLDVKIEKLTFGGKGLARINGVVIFVPLSAPNDLLKVKITEIEKNYLEAEIVEIIQAGESRISAPCKVFGQCGGCNWQHISYQEQLKQKQQIITDNFSKISGFSGPILPIIASPHDFRYRNRIQLKYKKPNLGFYARGSHQIVNIEDCLICEESLVQSFSKIRNSAQLKAQDEIPKIEPALNQAGLVDINWGETAFDLEGFSQVNRFQNEHLIQHTLKHLEDIEFEFFYDLYGGAGNFAFPVLSKFPKTKIKGVELNSKSVKLAHEKAKSLGLSPKKFEFYTSEVSSFLKRNILPTNSVVLIDPPRSGCDKVTLTALRNSTFKKLIYISCNPAALIRDLQILTEKSANGTSLKIESVQPFDMFPQTDHIETLVSLTIDS